MSWTDHRIIGSQPTRSSRRFDKLNAVKKSPYMAFMKRKLGEWYRAAPKGPAPARREPDDESERLAPSAGAAGAPEDGASTSAFTLALD